MLCQSVSAPVVSSARAGTVLQIGLEQCAAALLVCDVAGYILGATANALDLLGRLSVALGPLPAEIWSALTAYELGQDAEWRPASRPELVLGCMRHRLDDHWLLIISRCSSSRSWRGHSATVELHRQESSLATKAR